VELFVSAADGYRASDLYNDVIFSLPRTIHVPEYYSAYITLTSFSCPNTHLPVNEYNNVLVVNGITYTLPVANLSATALVSAIKGLLPTGFGVSYDTTTLKASIACSEPFTISGSALALLGMEPAVYVTSVTSTYTVAMSGPKALYLCTSWTGENVDARGGGSAGLATMARICYDVAPLEVLHFQAGSAPPGVTVHEGSVGSFRVTLEDEARRPLLASQSWDASFRVQFVWSGRRSLGYTRPAAIQGW
jgi:hypothetical protein